MAEDRKRSKHIDMDRDALAIKAEFLQTDQWAIEAILRCEIMTRRVVDPCCGDGRMGVTAAKYGYDVFSADKYAHVWGYGNTSDFLSDDKYDGWVHDSTVFMNPPFSLACEFVDRARELGARKIVCFQRSVWRECQDRREWWERNPYNRRYQCGDRAICWYGTIPQDLRKGGAYQPHSWYIWEVGQPAGCLDGVIWKDME